MADFAAPAFVEVVKGLAEVVNGFDQVEMLAYPETGLQQGWGEGVGLPVCPDLNE